MTSCMQELSRSGSSKLGTVLFYIWMCGGGLAIAIVLLTQSGSGGREWFGIGGLVVLLGWFLSWGKVADPGDGPRARSVQTARRATNKHYYTVTGDARFQPRLLFKHRCWPVDQTDLEQIKLSLKNDAYGTHTVNLVARRPPDREAWLDIGWRVADVEAGSLVGRG